ncbi:MAG: sodium:proton antiporter [Bacteroidetes bacterium GWA2_30_7]|nr:MAG: sodium:proton antiporter [Bacteroidetes bacterium GWA2_30_7]
MSTIIDKLNSLFQIPFKNSVLVFSLILFIILLAPLILRKLKIPGIIGLIISGVIIGPHALNIIEKNSAIDLFSTIGLLYIMFIAGLDLNLNEFSKYKYKSLTFGFLTFIIPLAIGFPVCYYVLQYDFNGSLLIASMFSTHTLISYPIINRLGITRNEAVAITVGGTIFTDTAVLLLLAFISVSATGLLDTAFWVKMLISMLVFLGISFYLIPRIAAWFFKKLESEKHSHFIFVLSIVFFLAFLAEVAGLEPIIGAFIAGLVLNKLIPHTSPLMNRIEFVGTSLFIPFFLISVGMIINIGVVFQSYNTIVIAIILTVIAIASKYIAAWLTTFVIKYNKVQRNLIFGLSSSHAAATLAIILVGFKLGIISEDVLNAVIILILVTCLVSSFVTENAGKKLVLIDKNLNNLPVQSINQKILVPISNSSSIERLLDLAFLIKEKKGRFPVLTLKVVNDDSNTNLNLIEAKKILEKATIHASSYDEQIEVITTIDQNIISGIKRIAKEFSATDIIIGYNSKSNISDFIFGKRFNSFIENVSQLILVSNIINPTHQHTRLVVICSQFSEIEIGFNYWNEIVDRIANNLNVSKFYFTHNDTYNKIIEIQNKNNNTTPSKFKEFTDLDDILIISKYILITDLVIFIMPRKGCISYSVFQSLIPQKMSKYFSENSSIFIHPPIDSSQLVQSFDNEYGNGLIEKGVNRITIGAKNISKIFKKESDSSEI